MQRRQFIQSAFLSGMMLNASGTVSAQNSPFGELRADPRKILDLPKGFSYTIISEQHSLMEDGLLTPGQADGMAAFQNKNGNINIVCNHENHPANFHYSAFDKNNSLMNLSLIHI